MTDREILEQLLAGQQKMQSDISGLKSDVAGLQSDVSGLKSDVAGLKSDVAGLQSDVSGLKSDVAGLQSNVAGLKSDVAELRMGQQEMNARLIRVENDVTAMKLRLENTTDKNIQIIAENYSNLVAKLDKNNVITDQQFAYQIKVNYLMDDVRMLKQDVKELRSAVGI